MDQHRLWVVLLSLRFLWALWPHRGYIHPDEFFQTVEVVAGDTFETDVERTWEFNSSFPIRSILIPKLLFQPAFKMLQISSENIASVSLSARNVICVSRFVMTALSVIVDLCVVSIASYTCLNKQSALTLLSSSYVMLCYLTHSFSNSVEAVLFSLILFVVIKSVRKDKVFLQENIIQETKIRKRIKPRFRNNSDTSWDEDMEEDDSGDMLSDSYGLIQKLHTSAFDLRKRKQTHSEADTSGANILSSNSDKSDEIDKIRKLDQHSTDMVAESSKIGSNTETHRHFQPYCSQSTDKEKSNNESVIICILLAIINTAGIFNRPTFVMFTAVPFLWWFSQFYKNGYLIYVRLTTFILVSFFTAVIFIVTDTVYYKNISWEVLLDLENLKSEIVITPLNFILYNTDVKNLEHHGRHPFYLHFLVNLPLLFGPLVISIFRNVKIAIFKITLNKHNNNEDEKFDDLENHQTSHFQHVLLMTILIPVFLLSVFPHQEPRFLIPLLLPVVLYIVLTQRTLSKKFYAVYFLFNFILAILYGILHQGGVIPCLMKLHSLSHEQDSLANHNVIFSHTYMPPKHPLFIAKNSSLLNIYDMKGASFDKIYNTIFDIRISELSNGPLISSHMYIAIPWNILINFKKKYSGKLRLKMVDKFFPHLSLDNPPSFRFKDSYTTVKNKLSLYLMEIESK